MRLLYQLSYVRTHQDVLVQSLQLLLGAEIRHAYITFRAANANRSSVKIPVITDLNLSYCKPPSPAKARTCLLPFVISSRSVAQGEEFAIPLKPHRRPGFIPPCERNPLIFRTYLHLFVKPGDPVTRLAWVDHFWRRLMRTSALAPLPGLSY